MLNLFGKHHQDHAKIVDGKLILSLPSATTPVVWQMDLSQFQTAALEVNDNNKNGFSLVMKTPKGETVEIAPFENKEQAVRSLMAASKALSNAQGQMKPAAQTASKNKNAAPLAASANEKKGGALKKTGLVLLGLLIIFMMLAYLNAQTPKSPSSLQTTGFDRAKSSSGDGTSVNETGVPVSADEFLKKR